MELRINYYNIKIIAYRAIDADLSPISKPSTSSYGKPGDAFVPLSVHDTSGQIALEYTEFFHSLMELQRRTNEETVTSNRSTSSARQPTLYFPTTLFQTLHVAQLILFVRLWMLKQSPWKETATEDQVALISRAYERSLADLKTASRL